MLPILELTKKTQNLTNYIFAKKMFQSKLTYINFKQNKILWGSNLMTCFSKYILKVEMFQLKQA